MKSMDRTGLLEFGVEVLVRACLLVSASRPRQKIRPAYSGDFEPCI
jgi:hypothetical protein